MRPDGPLAGVTVLEVGSFVAGPYAGQLLGDYGADVIKVEPLEGDPMRKWGVVIDGDSLWWPSIARNKRCVSIDLRQPDGREAVRRIAESCDIVIENFTPGRMAQWGLDFDTLSAKNPGLVLVHVSGFGQTGPRRHAPGFGSIGEAVGGVRYTTGSPDRPPSRAGISLGDALAALFSVIGALAAHAESRRTGVGQEVDVAIYEAVAALMESSMADFELGNVLRSRTGSVLPSVAPSNVYSTSDGADVVIAANADAIFARLCKAIGREELAGDDRFATHLARGQHMEALDDLISSWTATLPIDEVLRVLDEHSVPAGRIFTAADMLQDPLYQAREMVLRRTSFQGWDVPMPGVVPKFSRTPGNVVHAGPALGVHTREVLMEVAGYNADEVAALEATGSVGCAAEARA